MPAFHARMPFALARAAPAAALVVGPAAAMPEGGWPPPLLLCETRLPRELLRPARRLSALGSFIPAATQLAIDSGSGVQGKL